MRSGVPLLPSTSGKAGMQEHLMKREVALIGRHVFNCPPPHGFSGSAANNPITTAFFSDKVRDLTKSLKDLAHLRPLKHASWTGGKDPPTYAESMRADDPNPGSGSKEQVKAFNDDIAQARLLESEFEDDYKLANVAVCIALMHHMDAALKTLVSTLMPLDLTTLPDACFTLRAVLARVFRGPPRLEEARAHKQRVLAASEVKSAASLQQFVISLHDAIVTLEEQQSLAYIAIDTLVQNLAQDCDVRVKYKEILQHGEEDIDLQQVILDLHISDKIFGRASRDRQAPDTAQAPGGAARTQGGSRRIVVQQARLGSPPPPRSQAQARPLHELPPRAPPGQGAPARGTEGLIIMDHPDKLTSAVTPHAACAWCHGPATYSRSDGWHTEATCNIKKQGLPRGFKSHKHII